MLRRRRRRPERDETGFVRVLARVLAIVAGLGFAFFIAYYSSPGPFLIITGYGD